MNNPAVALVPWGDWIEDYLDDLDLDLAGFCNEMDGGWLFGYVEALKSAGFRPFLATVSREVDAPVRMIHRHSGSPVWFLPSPQLYVTLRQYLSRSDVAPPEDAIPLFSLPGRIATYAAHHLAPYAAWPVRSFDRVMEEEDCRAIVTQEYEYARFDVLIAQARRRGIPLFASFQGGTWHSSRIEDFLRRHTLARANGLIIPSRPEIERVQSAYGVPSNRVHRIYNPLDVDGWTTPARDGARNRLGIPADANVASWHGRIAYHPKGLDTLLDAWEGLRSRRAGHDDRLFLIGTGVDAPRLHHDLARRNLDGVHWRDEYVTDKDEIRRVLGAADVFVFPSRHEGFPVALIEGMASRLPVVAADAPGVREIMGVEEGSEVGSLVPIDDPVKLAAALGELFADRDQRLLLGSNARRRAEAAFSPAAIGKQLRSMIEPHLS